MPRLDTAIAGASAGQLAVPRANPRAAAAIAEGVGSLAEAGRRAGAGLVETELRVQEAEHDRALKDAKLWQLSTLAQDRSKWATRLRELQDAAPDGAPGFGDAVRDEFKTYRQEAIRSAPALVRKEYEARLDMVGADLFEKADIFQGVQKVAKQVQDYKTGLNADANTLLSDPAQFDGVLGLRLAIIDEMEIPGKKKAELKEGARQTLAAATVSALAISNPKEALASLKAGEWDTYLDADKKLALMRQTETAAKVGKAEARELLQDHIASIRATGVGVPGAVEAARNAYDPDELARIQKDVTLAQDFYDANQQILYAAPEDIMATLKSFQPKPGQENFADHQQTYTDLVRSAQTIARQRADDPAGFAASMPQVKLQAPTDGNPAMVRRSVRSNLAGQEAMGIPAVNRRILPKAQAQAIAADIMGKPMSERAAAILQLQETYGEHFPAVMKDLSDKGFNGFGLDPRTSVLASVAGTPALSQQLATVLETGPKELRDGLERDAVTTAEKTVREALAPWMQAVRNGAFGSEREPMLNGIAAAVEDLAISYVRNGEDSKTAAERAANSVINDRYTVQDTYYVPKDGPDGQPYSPGNIDDWLTKQQSREALEAAKVLPFGDTDLDRERTLRTAVESGYWVTNATGTGAYLMVPFRGGGALPLMKADGTRYEMRFREASMRGTQYSPPPEMTVSP